MKRIIPGVLVFLLVLTIVSMIPFTTQAASQSDLTFRLNSDGKSYTLSSCSSSASGELLIPNTYKGKPITAIGNSAFYNCMYLETILIPLSVKSIGDSAFYYCINLEHIFFGIDTPEDSALETIGDSAFYKCSSLEFISLPSGLKTIGDSAFYSCNELTEVTIPDKVTTIGDHAFENCQNLRSVTLPRDLQTIGYDVFRGCSKLFYNNDDKGGRYLCSYGNTHFLLVGLDSTKYTTYQIHSDTKHIYSHAFYGNSALTEITIPDGVVSIGASAFSGCSGLKSLTIPDSVKYIDGSAFHSCSRMNDVTIGNGVQTIGGYAFTGCSKLKSIAFGNSVASVGVGAFNGCNFLGAVQITDLAAWCRIVFADKGANPLWPNSGYLELNGTMITDLVIPDDVTLINSYAFSGSDAIKSVTIPDSVTGIGHGVFQGCVYLNKVTMGKGVEYIGENAFYCCTPDDVWYTGTIYDYERAEIYIYPGNEDLIAATWHYKQCTDEHIYRNDCVTRCDICGANRIAPHRYDGDCDTQCNDCVVTRTGKIGHTYTNDCDTDCNICGAERTITHDYAEATCELPAICKACGNTSGSMLGHSFTSYISNNDATCLGDGTKTAKCDRCEATDTVTDEGSKLKHNYPTAPEFCWADDYSTCTATLICSRGCGHKLSEDCTVTVDIIDPLQTVYTAKVSMEGIVYTDTVVSVREYIPGDADQDNKVTTDDAVYLLLSIMFGAEDYPLNKAMNIDFDGDGTEDTDDAVYLLLHVMFGQKDYPL